MREGQNTVCWWYGEMRIGGIWRRWRGLGRERRGKTAKC
jgi:hypothetical protein